MRWREIALEARAAPPPDREDIDAGLAAYATVRAWLDRVGGGSPFDDPPLPEGMFAPAWAPKALAIPARLAGLEDDLTLAFVRERSGINPMFGFTPGSGEPVIILPLLKWAGSMQGAAFAFRDSFVRREFVHEYTHYRDWRTSTDWSGRNGEELVVADAAYYNSPKEIRAFTVDALSSAFADIRQRVEDGLDIADVAAQDDRTMLARIVDRYVDRGFYEGLTPANRRRLRARILRFMQEHIRPLLAVEPA